MFQKYLHYYIAPQNISLFFYDFAFKSCVQYNLCFSSNIWTTQPFTSRSFYCKNLIRRENTISSTFFCISICTFSVLWPLYFDLSTSTSLLQLAYFDAYFDILSNMDFLLVEKHGFKYTFVEVKFRSK